MLGTSDIGERSGALTGRVILRLWVPLAMTWLMMGLEGPFLAGIIARLAEPKMNLAAFGVAFSFALLVEAPIIMMMSASTALVRDRDTYLRLRNFTLFLNAGISLVMLVLVWPPVFNFLTMNVMKLPAELTDLAHRSLVFFFPWPAAIGFRRFYHGILITANRTKRVAAGTAVRLSTIVMISLFLFGNESISGAELGAIALAVAVVVEAIVAWLMTVSTIRILRMTPSQKTREGGDLTYGKIVRFYYPLALTALLFLGINPLVTFFLGRSQFALESLAVYPVVNGLTFLFRSIGISFQEVSIALLGDRLENYGILRRYSMIGGIALSVALGVIAFSPLSEIWFRDISGLSLELVLFSDIPLRILVIVPGLTMLLSLQRAVLVTGRTTGPVTIATIYELAGVTFFLILTVGYLDMTGVTAAAVSLLLGRLLANIYLIGPNHHILSSEKTMRDPDGRMC